MRFTPTDNCQVKAGKVFIGFTSGASPEVCSLFVWDNQSGLPGARKASVAFTPPHTGWKRADLDSIVPYDTDFWLGIWLPPMSGDIGLGILYDNDGLTYPDRDATKESISATWKKLAFSGDLMIRAIVEYAGVEESSITQRLALNHAPNPVLRKTTISYALPEKTKVKLEIYDATGSLIRILLDDVQPAGDKEVVWNRRNKDGATVSSGVYFYRLTIENHSLTKSIVVL